MTLIELLVVVAIIGILSAAAIWNYFIAINRAKQKKTMADMRTIALSWELYAQDTESYIPAAAVFTFPSTTVPTDDIMSALVPKYIKGFPEKDGWGNEFQYGYESGPPEIYAIRSAGADGVWDESYDAKLTDSFNNDIVFSNGTFEISPKNK